VTRITWSPRSLRDLEAIRDYIAQDSPYYADLTVRRIFAAVERLSKFPQSGRVVPELRRVDVREVIIGSFRVVYRVRADTIEVVTVFHSARRFPQGV
jgi:toxin ParE1/3/4